MKCVICGKEITAATVHRELWIAVGGKMFAIPKKSNVSVFTCMNHIDDPVGDRCIDKLERGEF